MDNSDVHRQGSGQAGRAYGVENLRLEVPCTRSNKIALELVKQIDPLAQGQLLDAEIPAQK